MNKRTIAILIAVMSVATSSVAAGEAKTPSEKAERLVLISVLSPLIVGSVASIAVVDSIKGDSLPASPDNGEQVKAKTLPPMRVAKRTAQAGGAEITLVPVDARFGGEPTILHIPAANSTSADLMNTGDVVTLSPTSEANGWWLRSEGGTNLAYIPTSSTARLSGTTVL